jgi:hypothetical protein
MRCGSFHDIGGYKIQSHSRSVMMCVIGMDNQFSIRPPNLSVSPIGEWTNDLSNIIARIEFRTFRENIDEMKATEIPNYRKYHFFELDSLPLFCRNLSIRLKPDQLLVYIEIEPRLFKSHNIMPGSLLLTLQHGKKFSQECCPIQLLNV